MKAGFLDGHLMPAPRYCLCLSEKAFYSKLRQIKVPQGKWPEFCNPRAYACVHPFEDDDGQLYIVGVGNTKDASREEIYALLVHEAVHVWQHYCNDLGEDEPSDEFEAYSIQSISLNLMDEYIRQMKGGRKS